MPAVPVALSCMRSTHLIPQNNGAPPVGDEAAVQLEDKGKVIKKYQTNKEKNQPQGYIRRII